MLSRDEELQRMQRRAEHVEEEGVFEADEGSGRQSGSDPSSPLSWSPTDRHSPPLSRRSTSGTGSSSCRQLVPLASPLMSNVKVQVSPRFHPEPKKAGGLPDSPTKSGSPGSTSSHHSSQSTKLGPTSSRASSSKTGSSNAWSNPLLGGSGPPGTNWEAETERISQVEDVELRFALQLSLAEAQSRESAKK